ncbi:hypothetical protein R3I94_011934 [Phoxinus phoxinus]
MTLSSPASYTRPKPPAAPSQHSYPLLTGLYYAKTGLSGEACCFGLVRTAQDRTSYKSPLDKKEKKNQHGPYIGAH